MPTLVKTLIAFTCLFVIACHAPKNAVNDPPVVGEANYLIHVRCNNDPACEPLVLRTIGKFVSILCISRLDGSQTSKELEIRCFCRSDEKLTSMEQQLGETGAVKFVSIKRM